VKRSLASNALSAALQDETNFAEMPEVVAGR
jgi:hypothetical protein